MTYIYSTGKRKTSIARVFLKEGSGEITINEHKISPEENNKTLMIIKKTLTTVNMDNKIDLKITVKGGGTTGQIDAIKHGISKALVILNEKNTDEEPSFRKKLKKLGLLTRDSRKVERKKVGRRKARKKEQYSKR